MRYYYGYKNEDNEKNDCELDLNPARGEASANYNGDPKAKTTPGWVKAIIIILAIALGITMMTVGCTMSMGSMASNVSQNMSGLEYLLSGGTATYGTIPDDELYIAVLYIDGEISEDNTAKYNHKFVLNTIDTLIKDRNNLGLILWLDTPGGTVFASDDVYLKLKQYKKETGKPIYASMQSMAASGGYYIGCVADKIYINRNGWTGSIGVTMGQMFDVSELLDKLGVKVTTITAGKNKAMGSNFDPMTEEQRAIYKSLVDEAYEQFTGIVATERKMDLDYVKKLADGRVYTAKQALENGLVDEIGTYKDCINAMKDKVFADDDVPIIEFKTMNVTYSLSSLLGKSDINGKDADASYIQELANLNGKFKLSYMSDITN